MTEIIIHTDEPHPIGKIGSGTITVPPNKERVRVGIRITGIATYEEYLKFCKEQNVIHLITHPFDEDKFYFYRAEVLD